MADSFTLLEDRDAKAVLVTAKPEGRTPKAIKRVQEKRAEAAKLALASDLGPGPKPPKKRPARVDVAKSADRTRREIAKMVEEYAAQIPDWLSRVGKYDPEKALRIYTQLLEYHVPKQVRTEIEGKIQHQVAHFVAVETREARPEMIDVTPVQRDGGG